MLTKNFKALMKVVGLSAGNAKGVIPITKYNNTTVYLVNYFSGSSDPYPASYDYSLRLSSSIGKGINLGSGNTPATENDYTLENRISSGLTGTVIQSTEYTENDARIIIRLTLTNTSSESITVNEIGNFHHMLASSTPGGTGASNEICMIDRTVLSEPCVIPAGEIRIIEYSIISEF